MDNTITITINPATNCNAAVTSTSNAAKRTGAAELGSVGIVAAALLGVIVAL
jgi:hypothetical protein